MTDQNSSGPFEPTVTSLLGYQCPEWFRDAKFGIYMHWGAYSVVERAEWYVRDLYREGSPAYLHHCKTYGHPSAFGYKDIINLWKAENWEPETVVDLIKKAGARYFTPCAVHHDNFDLWNSTHHRWNSVNFGPKKDITGIWREKALEAGLRFGVTTHAARTWSWVQTNKGTDRSGPLKGVPYDGNDPEYRDLYLDPDPDGDVDQGQPYNAPAAWRQLWLARMKDLIDHYHPDHLYFDGSVPFRGMDNGRTGMQVLAHLYNDSLACHDGRQEAVMAIKNVGDSHGIYVDGIATLDLERRKLDDIRNDPWQTDTSIGPWGYRAEATYRPVRVLIHELVDIVSKNGNVLLNIPPKADGTLDDETVKILAEIGEWMSVNGEAIYGTRPWVVSEEGPWRFTRKGGTLYAILLERPENRQVLEIRSLSQARGIGPVQDVVLLGYDGELRWGHDREWRSGFRIVLPEDLPDRHALAFRIEFCAP